MQPEQIKVGKMYRAIVSGSEVTVQVDDIVDEKKFGKTGPHYHVTNLRTGKKLVWTKGHDRFITEVKDRKPGKKVKAEKPTESLFDCTGDLEETNGYSSIGSLEPLEEMSKKELIGLVKRLQLNQAPTATVENDEADLDKQLEKERNIRDRMDTMLPSYTPPNIRAEESVRPFVQAVGSTLVPAPVVKTELPRPSSSVKPGTIASVLAKAKQPVNSQAMVAKTQPTADHIVVKAFAGTGKTFTMIVGTAWAFGQKRWKEIVQTIGERNNEKRKKEGRQLLDLSKFDVIPSDEQMAVWKAMAMSKNIRTVTYCAFNKSIVTEFSEEWGWLVEVLKTCGVNLQFATVNALGNRTLYKSFGKLDVRDYHVENLLGEHLGRDIRAMKQDPRELTFVSAVKEVTGLCKLTLTGWKEGEDFHPDNVTPDLLYELTSHYDVEMEGLEERVYEVVPHMLQKSLDVNKYRCVDYNDQNWLPIVLNLPIPQVDMGLVDEQQDLPRSKQEFTRRMCKRFVGVGDENQAIYGFAGADTNSIPRMQELLGNGKPLEALTLTQTRRCGKAIVAEAQKIVPQFSAHESNSEGKVSYALYTSTNEKEPSYHYMVGDKDMVICRVNGPLVSQALKFLRDGRKVILRGRDFGKQLTTFVKKFNAKDLPELITKVDNWRDKETEKEQAKRNPNDAKLLNISDKHSCIIAFTEGAETVEDVITKIELVFAGKQCPRCKKHYNEETDTCPNNRCKTEKDPVTGYEIGPKLIRPEGILFSSIHRAKGLESARVFFLMPKGAGCPHPAAKSDWQRKQEIHCLYIGQTRAREELIYVR